MKVTSSKQKFSISSLHSDDLATLYKACVLLGSRSSLKIANSLRQALVDAEDEDAIRDEYGCSVSEYIDNFLA